jgi:hypothetical protein
MEKQYKPLEAEVRDSKNTIIKKGLVYEFTTSGARVYDPKEPKKEAPEHAEWFPFKAPNGMKTTIFDGSGNPINFKSKY